MSAERAHLEQKIYSDAVMKGIKPVGEEWQAYREKFVGNTV